MPFVSAFKKICWFSVAVAVLLFVGLISIIVVKTNEKTSVCEKFINVSKYEVLKCKGSLAYDSSKETMENLFQFYDQNTNVTGSQKKNREPEPEPQPSPKDAKNRKRDDKKSPETHLLIEYEPFLKCLTDVNCGIISKCAYDIEYKTTRQPNSVNQSKIEKDGGYMTNVYGSLYIIKNYVPYTVDYYWFIVGVNDDIAKQYGNKTLHKVRMQPQSAMYIDSRIISNHHIQVYLDERQTITTDGEKYKTNILELSEVKDSASLNGMSTINSPGVECQKYQACKYLSGVCFANDLGDDRCYTYQDACRFFYDSDRTVKDYELVDYFYTYYPSCIPKNATINPTEISDWVCKGGGISGSDVGKISSTPVIVLAILLSTSFVVHVACFYSFYKFKRTLGQLDTPYDVDYNDDTGF